MRELMPTAKLETSVGDQYVQLRLTDKTISFKDAARVDKDSDDFETDLHTAFDSLADRHRAIWELMQHARKNEGAAQC